MDYYYCSKLLHFYALIFCFFFLFVHGFYSKSPSETKLVFSVEADGNYYKNLERNNIWEVDEGMRRRLLGGPGSSPPRCTFKCGGCTPCVPVHVPVPPGTRVTMEYYPEAWRCKCGDKLYMP